MPTPASGADPSRRSHGGPETLRAEALPGGQATEIRARRQQQRALGRDSDRAMVEAGTDRFTGIRRATAPVANKHLSTERPNRFARLRSEINPNGRGERVTFLCYIAVPW
jgi:hypothetical protein